MMTAMISFNMKPGEFVGGLIFTIISGGSARGHDPTLKGASEIEFGS